MDRRVNGWTNAWWMKGCIGKWVNTDQTTHADHQTMLHKHSLVERSVSWANSTPLWGLLNTILDTWLINRPNTSIVLV